MSQIVIGVFVGIFSALFCFLVGMLAERVVWLQKAHNKDPKDRIWRWGVISIKLERIEE